MADLVIKNARLYSPGLEIQGNSLGVSGGLIEWIGDQSYAPDGKETIDAEGRWLTPGLIDCHTHAVYAGNRSVEFEKRLSGVSYQQIAAEGGGILSTVRATRSANYDELLRLAQARIDQLTAGGVTTVDVKSGYGLSLESELKCLKVASELIGPRIIRGFLGAHSVPPEFLDRSDDYIEYLITEVLPLARLESDYVDAFCESIAFSARQVERLFQATTLPVRLHADQLSDTGGGALAAKFGALSADHLEFVSEASLDAMAEVGTVAVLLPGAYYQLGETLKPPVAKMRDRRIKLAISSDLNPGTSPIASIPLIMSMSAVLFGLSVQECWLGVTTNAAAALGRPDLGVLKIGAPADLALWNFEHPRDIVATIGMPYLTNSWREGEMIFSSCLPKT